MLVLQDVQPQTPSPSPNVLLRSTYSNALRFVDSGLVRRTGATVGDLLCLFRLLFKLTSERSFVDGVRSSDLIACNDVDIGRFSRPLNCVRWCASNINRR